MGFRVYNVCTVCCISAWKFQIKLMLQKRFLFGLAVEFWHDARSKLIHDDRYHGNHATTTNTSTATTGMVSVAIAQNQLSMSSLPSGKQMPNPLKLGDDITNNWKKFKRTWDNYVMVVRLQRSLLCLLCDHHRE